MRIYEVIFVIRPDVPEADVDTLTDSFAQAVTSLGGKVEKVEKWGKRRLAYRVAGNSEGSYVFLEMNATGAILQELERRLKVSEPVIKYLSVRVDLERKRLEKLRRRREHRAVRRQRKAPASAEASAGTA